MIAPNRRDSFLHFVNYIEKAQSSPETKDSDIHWVDQLDLAQELGVGSIIYHRMKEGGLLPRVPEEIQKKCKARLYWSQARNMRRFGRLQEVLGAFSSEEILVIVLKGGALAELVYPHMGLRPMGDIDLLVHEDDIAQAERILVSLGFHANEREHSKEWYRKFHHHIVPYVSQDKSLVIELHHQLIAFSAPIKIPNFDLWKRSKAEKFLGSQCRVLSPEDLLIHLSLHLAVDAYIGKMKTLYDLTQTINHYRGVLDWTILVSLAQEYNISKYLYYAFWLARETVCADVPTSVLGKLKAQFSGLPFEDVVIKHLIRKGVIITDQNSRPMYSWILGMTILSVLSHQGRLKKLKRIIGRTLRQYRAYSQKHATQEGMSLTWYLLVKYPVYLIRKMLGISVCPVVGSSKKP